MCMVCGDRRRYEGRPNTFRGVSYDSGGEYYAAIVQAFLHCGPTIRQEVLPIFDQATDKDLAHDLVHIWNFGAGFRMKRLEQAFAEHRLMVKSG